MAKKLVLKTALVFKLARFHKVAKPTAGRQALASALRVLLTQLPTQALPPTIHSQQPMLPMVVLPLIKF